MERAAVHTDVSAMARRELNGALALVDWQQ